MEYVLDGIRQARNEPDGLIRASPRPIVHDPVIDQLLGGRSEGPSRPPVLLAAAAAAVAAVPFGADDKAFSVPDISVG